MATGILTHPIVVVIVGVFATGFMSLMVWIVKSQIKTGNILVSVTQSIQNILEDQKKDHNDLEELRLDHERLSGDHQKKRTHCQHCGT